MKEEKLLQLLRKKRGFFEAILELTEEEEHFSVDEWVLGLKQKKILLSCVDKIDEELVLFKEALDTLSQEIVEEVEMIKSVLQEILYLDKINQAKRKNSLLKS